MSFASGLKTIVVATDLDGRAEAALEYARKLAHAYGSRIVLAHGLDPLDYASVSAVPGKVLRNLTEQARATLDQMSADLVREGIHSHSEVHQGEVAQMLVDVARHHEAGLIVIGTEGRQGAGPVVVGAIAEQLVRLAPCPVLAVAADYNAGAFRPVPGGPVMLAMERNDATAEASATACSLAETFHRTLIVVHARKPEEAVAFLNPMATTVKEFGIESEGRFPVRCIVKDGKPGRCDGGGDRAISTQCAGDWREAGQRNSGAAWHGIHSPGSVARTGALRSSRGAGRCSGTGNLCRRSILTTCEGLDKRIGEGR